MVSRGLICSVGASVGASVGLAEVLTSVPAIVYSSVGIFVVESGDVDDDDELLPEQPANAAVIAAAVRTAAIFLFILDILSFFIPIANA